MSLALGCLFSIGLLASPEIQGVRFPLGGRCIPGRWFPVAVSLRSPARDWEGEIRLQTEEAGPIFDRSIRIQKGEEKSFQIPVLFRSFPSRIAVEVGYSKASFDGPPRATSPTWLLVGTSPVEARRILAEDPSLPLGSLDEAARVGANELPQDLYPLDGVDFLFVQEEAVEALSSSSRGLLLRWALIRGRLLTTEGGKQRFGASGGLAFLLEVPDGTRPRRLPRQELPPDPLPVLLPRDFAEPGDPAAVCLALYLGVGLLHLLGAGWFRNLSAVSLAAGLSCLLLVVPGVGWPQETAPWRTLVGHEESSSFLVEDRFYGSTEALDLDPAQALFLPSPGIRFFAEWRTGVRFLWVDGEAKVHSATVLAEAGIERAAGGRFRNRFAPLEDVCWSAGGMASVGFRDRLPFGDLLEPGDDVRPPRRRLARPLADFLGAQWVTGDWILGRVRGAEPAAAWRPLGRRPHAVYLIWFPRPLQ